MSMIEENTAESLLVAKVMPITIMMLMLCDCVRAELSSLALGPFAPWFNVCIVGSVVKVVLFHDVL